MFDVNTELLKLADNDYKVFNKKLCPDTNRELIGVRIPQLRVLAKRIIKEDWKNWLKTAPNKYFEDVLLEGLVIAYSPICFKEKISLIQSFIPKIDSWEISDSFVPTLKIKKDELELAFDFIKPYLKSNNEFEIRFAIIMLLDYFIIDKYVDRTIEILDNINHDGYYVKMAVAWCLAEIGIKYNNKFIGYITNSNLDNFTYNKTLQKMIESYRITNEQKDILRKMKRK